ncbi:uncharacterized protein [Pseudorasbora parva]|uniref:uncharacterized protein n=1 Tax=Pseudorasbora parva TaxID=51549 RepID=UPI00351DDC79
MSYSGNMNVPRNHDMDREDEEEMNDYCKMDPISRSDTKSHQTPQHIGSNTVRNRSSRAARVCLVLLCVLLLTAVIVLCVHIHTKSTNYTEETHRLLTKITNLTEERDELLTKITNLTKERDELLTKITNLTKERDELLTKITDLTEERDQLNKEKNELSKSLQERDGWTYYKSHLYFFSSEKKSWTESRRYCTERRADLIIINNREEQSFVKKISADVKVWIGLTDGDVEGRWKWVDGSTLTSGFWAYGEPNSFLGTDEDCALNDESGWFDYPCNHAYQWIYLGQRKFADWEVKDCLVKTGALTEVCKLMKEDGDFCHNSRETAVGMMLLRSLVEKRQRIQWCFLKLLKGRSSEQCKPFEETISNNLTSNSSRLNMSYYGNMNVPRNHDMDREDEEEMNVYCNVDPISSSEVRTETANSDTKSHQTPQHTGSDTVRNRSSRAARVCLVLLCVLLLTAVIVLCVHIHTKSTNYTEETHRLLTNLTEERDELLTKITNLTEERDELLTKIITNLTEERDQLLNKITEERDELLTKITEERDELPTKITNLTEERDKLPTKITNLTKERDQQEIRNTNITEDRDQLLSKIADLTEERDQLNKEKNELSKSLKERDGWTYYKSSLYFFSSEKKSWTDSRRYCTERRADLIIINNREEQGFVKNISDDVFWIGLTDGDVEGRWEWVDGSTLTSGFWAYGEPNSNGGDEDCAVIYGPGLADYPCNHTIQWICEKVI